MIFPILITLAICWFFASWAIYRIKEDAILWQSALIPPTIPFILFVDLALAIYGKVRGNNGPN